MAMQTSYSRLGDCHDDQYGSRIEFLFASRGFIGD